MFGFVLFFTKTDYKDSTARPQNVGVVYEHKVCYERNVFLLFKMNLFLVSEPKE